MAVNFPSLRLTAALICLPLFTLPALAQNPLATIGGQNGNAPKMGKRLRSSKYIRLGGYFNMGLGSGSSPYEKSAQHGTLLSDTNRDWISKYCDVIALNACNITPKTFPEMMKSSDLITTLIHLRVSTLNEKDQTPGNVGGWSPAMSAWTLRDLNGKEVKNPEAGSHWMDFGNGHWAEHWKNRAWLLRDRYNAYGILASELPTGNNFVPDKLGKYKRFRDRSQAARAWLKLARAQGTFLMIPSSVGFSAIAGHPIEPLPIALAEPELVGRLWDDYQPWIDGGWSEGWLRPYWTGKAVSEKEWEISLEAADRAVTADQVFIAAGAYHDVNELEYLISSLLLVQKRQGRLVFQPMPLRKGQPVDAGFSIAVMRAEYARFQNFFDVELGYPLQVRHPVEAAVGIVWRRAFDRGVVYVNSNQWKTAQVELTGPMQRINGQLTKKLVLPPQSGAILLYPKDKPKKVNPKTAKPVDINSKAVKPGAANPKVK